MFRLSRLLTTLLAFTLLAANSASAITAASVEKPASGLFGVLEQRTGIDALASSDRVDEKLSLYDFASDFSVAAREAEFAGGAYGKLKSVAGWERHHMPAISMSPLSRARGPSIQMEQAEHALTSSYGNSAAAQAYRQEIGTLIQQGRWRDAMSREIRDVRRIAGSKYNQAVQQMLEYGRSIGIVD